MASFSAVQSIDELLAGRAYQNQDRADYIAADSSLVIELKSLESDTEWKVEKILAPHRERAEFPHFYGGWELSKILKHLPDGDDIYQRIFQAITTSVRAIFRKAEGQIRETKETFNIPEAHGLLIILNEHVEVLNPQTLLWTLKKLAHSRMENGDFRYTRVRAALLISEAHGKELPGNILGHPVLLMPFGNGNPFDLEGFVHELNQGWSDFNQASLVDSEIKYESTKDLDFENVSALYSAKERLIPRQEADVRYYKRNPYFRRFDNEELRWFFRVIMFETSRGIIKGGSQQEHQNTMYFWGPVFTHFMEEVNYRGIDLRYFMRDGKAFEEIDGLMARRFSDFEVPHRDL